MAFNITKKFAGGVAGSALLMFGAATAAGSAVAATPPQTAGADPSATTHVVNDQEVLARLLDQGDAPYVRLDVYKRQRQATSFATGSRRSSLRKQ